MTAYRMLNVVVLLAISAFGNSAVALPTARLMQPGQVFLIAEDVPKPESDATTSDENMQGHTLATQALETCMKNWDPGTHMTRDEWRQSCKRITEERLPYVKGRSDRSN